METGVDENRLEVAILEMKWNEKLKGWDNVTNYIAKSIFNGQILFFSKFPTTFMAFIVVSLLQKPDGGHMKKIGDCSKLKH